VDKEVTEIMYCGK